MYNGPIDVLNKTYKMAVQKSKKSRSRRDMRRMHDSLNTSQLTIDKTSKEIHLRHNVSPNGYYKGKKVIADAKEK